MPKRVIDLSVKLPYLHNSVDPAHLAQSYKQQQVQPKAPTFAKQISVPTNQPLPRFLVV